jgi:hypothetical protein
MRAARSLVAVLLGCLVAAGLPGVRGANPQDKEKDKDALPEEPKRLNEAIEKSVTWYGVLPETGAAPLAPKPVMRWRNVVRGQEGEAMMVVWPHKGRPIAMTSIYPWQGNMCHEFDSLSREGKVVAMEQDQIIWAPRAAGVEFKAMPGAPAPARTPAERLRQMKAVAERFKATMTGWRGDNADREELRPLPRPLYRYELAGVKDPDPTLLDGGLFAYVLGTDPEVVLVLEAVGTAEKAGWQYAFVRATSGALEVKLGNEEVWTADKYPAARNPTLPHFTKQRPLEKE